MSIKTRRKGSRQERKILSIMECGFDFFVLGSDPGYPNRKQRHFVAGVSLCTMQWQSSSRPVHLCENMTFMSLEVNETTVDLLRACWSLL